MVGWRGWSGYRGLEGGGLEGWKRDISDTIRNRFGAMSIPGFGDTLRFDSDMVSIATKVLLKD